MHTHITHTQHTHRSHMHITHPTHTYHTNTHTPHTHITHLTCIPHTRHTHITHIYMPHTKHTHHTHRSHTSHTYITHIPHTPHICTHRSLYSCFLLLPRPESTWLRPFGWNLCWCPGLPCSVVKVETSQIWPLDIPLTGHSFPAAQSWRVRPAFPNLAAEYVGFQTQYIPIHVQCFLLLLFTEMCLEHVQIYHTVLLSFLMSHIKALFSSTHINVIEI